jgi:hypothetical protein
VARLAALPATLEWARARRGAPPRLELLAATLAADQPQAVATGILRGLGLSGAPLGRVRDTLAAAPALRQRLASATRPSQAARVLREAGPLGPAWLHLADDEATRGRLARVRPDEAARPLLGGEALLGLGVGRGPELSAVLNALRDARLDGEIHDRSGEIDYVKTWLSTRTKEG